MGPAVSRFAAAAGSNGATAKMRFGALAFSWIRPLSRLVFEAAPIEPGLQEHRGRGAVDSLLPPPRIRPALTEPARRFDGGEPLVDELDGEARDLGDGARKSPRLSRRISLFPAHIEGQADEEALDFLFLGDARDLGEEFFAVAGIERRPRMREHPELVRDGEANASLAVIEGGNTHGGRF